MDNTDNTKDGSCLEPPPANYQQNICGQLLSFLTSIGLFG